MSGTEVAPGATFRFRFSGKMLAAPLWAGIGVKLRAVPFERSKDVLVAMLLAPMFTANRLPSVIIRYRNRADGRSLEMATARTFWMFSPGPGKVPRALGTTDSGDGVRSHKLTCPGDWPGEHANAMPLAATNTSLKSWGGLFGSGNGGQLDTA